MVEMNEAQTANATMSSEDTRDKEEPHSESSNSLDKPTPKSPYVDSGNFPHIHYKTKIHPWRFQVRRWLLPHIRAETDVLFAIQSALRHPALDTYFAWTANLASHTFYVVMLPLPLWFGYGKTTRDLVLLLGYGIFISGYIKDFCCLPRPRSPPLHRITMSGYTAKEYGFPSSHSANATAVTMLMLSNTLSNGQSIDTTVWWCIVLGLCAYYTSLVVGRVYCGMHGFADILVGSFIGAALHLIRSLTRDWYDELILTGSILRPMAMAAVNYALIYFHVQPVDDCPCYDDSVAFIGVIIGLEFSQWFFTRSSLRSNVMDPMDLNIHFSFKEAGITNCILRIIVGMALVAIWKEISKPLLLKLFQPMYALMEHRAEAPTFNRIRSDTMNKREKLADVTGLVKDLSKRRARVSVGPESTIDMTEVEDLGEHPHYFEALDQLQHENTVFTCGVFKQRYDISVIVRLLVYAGVPCMAIVVFPVVADVLGI